MRAVVQRCRAASVRVSGELVGAIEEGLVAFVGVGEEDGDADADYVAHKLVRLRVFQDEAGKMARSLLDTGFSLLAVSQFTLFGDVRRGNRPGFDAAMRPEEAHRLFERVVDRARVAGVRVETGRFGADMRVSVENDGPVTILVDSKRLF